MTFDQYTYFTANKPDAVKKIIEVSGLSQMLSLINQVKSMVYPVLAVEDAPELDLDIDDKDFEDQMHTFYVLVQANQTNGAKRRAAYTIAYAIGKSLLKTMVLPFGIKLDKTDIHVFKVGPLGNNAFGYGFTYNILEQ